MIPARPAREAVVLAAGDTLACAVVAGVVSGVPSTLWALLRGDDPLEPARAAGSMLAPSAGPAGLLVAGGLVHAVVSTVWAGVLAVSLPPRREPLVGAAAGLAIAALDLGAIAPRGFSRVAALELGPQVADHLVFGAAVGLVMRARRLRRRRGYRAAAASRSRRYAAAVRSFQ